MNIHLQIRFLAALKSVVGKDQINLTIKSSSFTLEDLIVKLTSEIGNEFNDLIINKKTKEINPDILIFINNAEVQTLQKLKTPFSDGDQITFLSSIHGG
jgi:molybdopterin converting factor small subunit